MMQQASENQVFSYFSPLMPHYRSNIEKLKQQIVAWGTCLSVIMFSILADCGAQERVTISSALPDTASINRFIKATDSIQDLHPDSAARRYSQALKLSRAMEHDEAILNCLTKLGSY